eukprot:6989-Heterococcus_DN1.PRE.1
MSRHNCTITIVCIASTAVTYCAQRAPALLRVVSSQLAVSDYPSTPNSLSATQAAAPNPNLIEAVVHMQLAA